MASQRDRALAIPLPLAVDQDRALRQQVGNGDRLHFVDVEALGGEGRPREDRRADVLPEPVRRLLRLGLLRDDEGFAGPHAGHALDEEAVDGGTDAEGEDVRIAEVVPDQIEDLGLGVDVAVGGDHDGTGRLRAWPGQPHGAQEGRPEPGSAPSLLYLDEFEGPRHVLL